jgi:hypothetical protein
MKNIKEIVFGTSFFFEIDWGIFLCKMLVKRIIEKHAIVIAGLFRREYFGEKCNQFVFVCVRGPTNGLPRDDHSQYASLRAKKCAFPPKAVSASG